jgi:transposase
LQTGTAPIPCSTGQNRRYRLNRGGDRQLNHALHVIAITRARVDPQTRAFLERKRGEGKTNKGAIRCLKRHLARQFHGLLVIPALDARQAPDEPAGTPRADEATINGAAPMLMPCHR